MDNWIERTELLLKKEGIEKLQNSNILVVGLGGVGSFAAEFLVRAGIGKITIVDGDTVDTTNRNRQLPALKSTVGKHKVDIMEARLLDINPELQITKLNEFLSPERMFEVVTNEYDYILDCIDSITPKLNLLVTARRKKVKIVSAMGAGGKKDVTKIKITDISKTKQCYLAKTIRKALKKEGIDKGIRCVFSTEIQDEKSLAMTDGSNYKRSYYGTVSYMPALFGLYAASEVINKIIKN